MLASISDALFMVDKLIATTHEVDKTLKEMYGPIRFTSIALISKNFSSRTLAHTEKFNKEDVL